MQKSFLAYFNEACDNITKQFKGFLLAESSLFLNESTEIALVTELSYNVTMRGLSDNIEALQHVVMLDGFEGFYLAIEHLSADGVFDSFHVDGLDCYGFV